ncbi:F-box protein At5g46170-like [Curcuma longa]|uniref:F-box protein At5g46170-like n=1 Tax=Curcuma longa TaxID=136217 RepID=UPI003D9F11C4
MSSSGALPGADLDWDWLLARGSDLPPPAAESGEEAIDHFDQLPDSVLLLIFNLVGDIKQLGRCCVVSRRFHAVVPLVDDVVVRVDCVISDDPCPSPDAVAGGEAVLSQKPRSVVSHLARLVLDGLVKPLQALGQILSPASASVSRASSPSSSSSSSPSPDVAHHSPSEVLKNFREIRRLRIELPDGELGKNGGFLLKWRADFGSTIRSCVILGASSVVSASSNSLKSTNLNSNPSSDDACLGDDYESIPESFYTNGSLKRRVVWTISSLIAASARHYLLHPIVVDHEPLESLILTDADGQGVLTMDRQQLQELRLKPLMASGSSQRTLLPALSMRLWYAHELELSCGLVLKGATLLAIKPSDERSRDVGSSITVSNDFSDSCWISECFEEPYRTATMMLMKRRNYCLEMNSF